MEYRMIAKLEHVQVKDVLNSGFKIYSNIKISNGRGIINKYFSDTSFISSIGNIEYDNLMNSTYIYAIGDTDEELETHHERVLFLDKLLEIGRMLCHATWLYKDNSIAIDKGFLYTPNQLATTSNSWHSSILNYKGEYQHIELSKKVMVDHMKKLEVLNLDYCYYKHENLNIDIGSSRLSRSFLYLCAARSQYLLPMKITLYITALEALFSNDKSEISHKIAERIAFYLSGTYKERLKIYRLIKDGYSIRSASVHGSKLPKKFRGKEKIEDKTEELDELMRVLYNKIFSSENEHEKFYDNNDKEFNEFIEMLVLGIK